MTLYSVLINLLVFCAILLLLAITVAVVQGVIVMIEVRRTTRNVTKKIETLTSIIDIGTLLLGGVDGAARRVKQSLLPGRANLTALIAGIKKGLQVLFNK